MTTSSRTTPQTSTILSCTGRALVPSSKVRWHNRSTCSVCLLTRIIDGGLLAWVTTGVNTTNSEFPQPPNQKRDVIDWHLH